VDERGADTIGFVAYHLRRLSEAVIHSESRFALQARKQQLHAAD
jgi:hypothetical protein